MRAIEFLGPSQVRVRDDVPTPEPKEGEVLVQCRFVALCGTNMGPYLYAGRWANPDISRPPGWLGHENVGVVVKSRAAGWEEGTLVLAHPDDYNGFVEYMRSKPAGLARFPPRYQAGGARGRFDSPLSGATARVAPDSLGRRVPICR